MGEGYNHLVFWYVEKVAYEANAWFPLQHTVILHYYLMLSSEEKAGLASGKSKKLIEGMTHRIDNQRCFAAKVEVFFLGY